jgi:hypothetical protein
MKPQLDPIAPGIEKRTVTPRRRCHHASQPPTITFKADIGISPFYAPTTIVANDPEDWKGTLKGIGGSLSDSWNNILANQTINALWPKHSDPEARDKQYSATVAALACIGPRDELEAMMAAQLIAAHNAAMECYRRAMLPEQTFEGRREALAQASKLSRTYATLVEALNRHRGKGQQKVTVGASAKSKDQPQALGYAPGEEMRSTHEERDTLRVPRDGKR